MDKAIKHTITAFFSFLLQTVLLIDCQYSVSVLCMTVTVGPFFFFSLVVQLKELSCCDQQDVSLTIAVPEAALVKYLWLPTLT